jgi:arylsulfatase A
MNKTEQISRRSFLTAAAAATLAAGCSVSAGGRKPVRKLVRRKPNIVFFIADDMHPKNFNCLPQGKGKNLTPNIDRLATEGVIMTGQHVASPICTPSRYNVLTGRYASRAQNHFFKQRTAAEGQTVVEFNTHILKTDVTLAKLLQKAGYATGMVGKNHVVQVSGLKRFHNFDASAKDPRNAATLKANHDHVCQAIRETGFDYVDRVYHNNPHFLGLHELAVQNMEWITEGGLNFIDKNRDKPFFLYFATTVPHGPTDAKHSWNANPLISAVGYLKTAPKVQAPRSTISKRLKAAGLPVNRNTANMLWLDDAVGALLDKLKKTGQLDDTVFFFFSDHGQSSKGTVYQGGVHDPSVVWRKGGFPCGPKSDALVHIVDFAPTILDIAGYDYSGDTFDGESFFPQLKGEPQKANRVLYFELGYSRAVRKGLWKYIAVRYPEQMEEMSMEKRKKVLDEWNAARRRRHLPIVTKDPTAKFSHLTPIPGGGHAEAASTGVYPGYHDRDQLYDLSKDPTEQKNLANDPKYKQKLKEMKQELQKTLDTLPGKFNL